MVVWPLLLVLSPPAGPFVPLTADAHRDSPTFAADQPAVGTYFFYWYNSDTGEHFRDGDGTDALTTHPLRRPGLRYSYDSPAWWRDQLAEVRAAGLDFLAPVYWGVPGRENWSKAGLRILATVLAEDRQAGRPTLPVAMFYDTSTLRHNPSGAVALDTPEGQTWFYETIRDFWSILPPAHWARVDGRPLILLYAAAFAKSHDPGLFAAVKQRFRADFGVEPYLVKEVSWPGQADGEVSWGGALGLKLGTVAALGPGYDHSAVPGRQPLVVDRRGGDFYREQWSRLLARDPATRPKLVMVETWNEFHEGTDVAPSVESGRLYQELTRAYADRFRAGAVLPRAGRFGQATSVRWSAADPSDGGLHPTPRADGPLRTDERGGVACLVTDPNPHGTPRYCYVAIDDSFWFDEPGPPVRLTVTVWDAGAPSVEVHFDSRDPQGSVRAGAFKSAGSAPLKGEAAWRTLTFDLPDPRFGDRTNGADLRLAIAGGELAVREIVIEKLPAP